MEPSAEHEYIKATYSPFGVRDGVFWIALFALLGVVSQFRDVDWWLMVAVVGSAIGWEFTKARLRRNARELAEASRRAA
ncbi:hypothetical protein [Nocardioides cavernaquae]|uniref:Uncharacterized protein n=1 Tax=Nocardioides cavernaquae TaxID=2321396 RepID=A0A3A5H9U2_9ACTN|nr:hypothetical protein [Nocardioides cavernaquae]RJS44820.1 hypothetical protein D4739_00230 [Nocardioides cavernaquae]